MLPVQSENVAAWKNGKLAFIDMPYQDIAIRLQSWYGVKFVFKNPGTKKTRFTASFNNKILLNDLLEVMFDVSHINYSYDSNTKTITFLQ